MSTSDALVAAVRAALTAQANPDNATAMAAYMKTDDPYFGVKATPRRRISGEAAKRFPARDAHEYAENVRALWAQPEREFRHVALDYARRFKRFIRPSSLTLYEELIRSGQWWDTVDEIAGHLVGGAMNADPEGVLSLMDVWLDDDDMWIRRTAILSQLKRKEKTDQERLFRYCRARMHEKEFFIRKAVGWALRQYSYVAPEAVKRFLEENHKHLSGLSFREGSKQLTRVGLAPHVA